MKKKILSIAAGLLLTAISSTSFAQTVQVNETSTKSSEKAFNAFDEQFGNSMTPASYISGNGGIILKGEIGNREVTSVFNKKGNWVYSITRYPSTSLEKNVIDIVERGYDTRGYYITSMEKVDQPGLETVFIVHLKGNDSYKTLRVVANDVEVVEDFEIA